MEHKSASRCEHPSALPGYELTIGRVTSFRPRSAHVADDTVLTSVRPISDLSELYYEFGEYRMEILEERLRAKLKYLRERRQAGKKLDTKEFKTFLAEQEAFLKHMNNEMVEEDKVAVGYIDEIVIPDVKVEEEAQTGRSVKRVRNE